MCILGLRRCAGIASRSAAAAKRWMPRASWLARDEVAAVSQGLQAYSRGRPLGDIPALERLVADHHHAAEFAGALFADFSATLREQPLGEVPLRHGSSAGFARLQLMQAGGAVLSLCVYEPVAPAPPPETAQFVDCELHELVLAGRASGIFCRSRGGRAPATAAHDWSAGDRITRRPRSDARQFSEVTQSLLVLQLSRTPERPRPSVDLRLCDGAILRQTSGDRRASEQVMALAVLGALGRAEAVPAMRDFALDRAGDADARWEAVRQVIALDTREGLSLINAIPALDPLHGPARALRESIRAAHPVLRHDEMETG